MVRRAGTPQGTARVGPSSLSYAVLVSFLLALLCAPAHADETCKQSAFETFSRINGSGPFHYETKQVAGETLHRSTGEVVPGLGRHVQVEKAGHVDSEYVQIRDLSWNKDAFGWADPVSARRPSGLDVLEFPFQVKKAACKSITDFGGRRLNVYEITLIRQEGTHYTLYADPASGLPVRLETSSTGDTLKVTTYTFDAAIRIDPPVVDHAERRNRSLRQFVVAVAQSEPECHAAALRDIAAANALHSYTFEVEGFLATGIRAIEGSVVAPSALHYRLIGSPDHGGGNERIVIGSKVWDKASLWTPARTDADYLANFLARSLPHPDMIGAVTCHGEAKLGGRTVRSYSYDLYQDPGTVKALLEHRRVTIDAESGEVVEIKTLDDRGNVLRIEHRTYEAGLTITPPDAETHERLLQAAQH